MEKSEQKKKEACELIDKYHKTLLNSAGSWETIKENFKKVNDLLPKNKVEEEKEEMCTDGNGIGIIFQPAIAIIERRDKVSKLQKKLDKIQKEIDKL